MSGLENYMSADKCFKFYVGMNKRLFKKWSEEHVKA